MKVLSLTVGTYNVLHPYQQNRFSFLPNGGADWDSRVGIIASNLLTTSDAILCLQEISQDHFQDLKGRIGHVYEGFHTKHDGRVAPEKQDGVALFYRKDKFILKAVKTCSRIERTTTSRRDLYIDVEEPVTQSVIRCATAHIDGNPVRPEIGNQQLEEILNFVSTDSPHQSDSLDAVIIGCDLNEESGGGRFGIFRKANFMTFVSQQAESEVNRDRQIDWVFFKIFNQKLIPTPPLRIHDELPNGSDHRLVSARMTIPYPAPFEVHPPPLSPISSPLPIADEEETTSSLSQYEKFLDKVSDTFSAKNALWLTPLSILTLGLLPLMITIFWFLYSIILHNTK